MVLDCAGILGSPHCLDAIFFCILLHMSCTSVPLMLALIVFIPPVLADRGSLLSGGAVFMSAGLEKRLGRSLGGRQSFLKDLHRSFPGSAVLNNDAP